MPGVTASLVASPPPLRGVWAHRMLWQFSRSACIQACGGNRASHHCQLRAGWGLVLWFREAENDPGCGVASAAFTSNKSTRARTRRESPGQLGIAPAL